MELRKIQKTGGTTYIVSLPKKWVQKENLDKGSVLSLEELRDGALRLSPKIGEEKQPRTAEISTDKNLRRRIIEHYLLGCDTLFIKSQANLTEKQKTEIKKTAKNLIGLEPLEETSNSLTLQCLLDPEEVSIHKSLRRMYSIISVMHRDLITAAGTGDKNLLRDVVQRDLEVNRLYFLVVRQIRTVIQSARLQDKEGITAVDCVDYRLVAKILEQIGDSLESAAAALLSNTKPAQRPTTLAKESYDALSSTATAFFKGDVNLAMAARKQAQKLLENWKKPKTPAAEHFLKILSLSMDLSDNVTAR